MIIVTRAEVTEAEIDGIREHVERCGVRSYLTTTAGRTVIGCLVELDEGEAAEIERLPGVETTTAWRAPYRLASRQLAPPGSRSISAASPSSSSTRQPITVRPAVVAR